MRKHRKEADAEVATREDAALVVQIMQLAEQMNVGAAVRAVMAEDFDPQEVSATDPEVGPLLSVGEVLGAFVKHGVLDRDLVLDIWPIRWGWDKLEPVVRRERERGGESALFENFEWLAKS
jgi:hypothetical protein